jgi:formiminoglutamase
MEFLKKYKYINKEFFRNYRRVKKNIWNGRIDGDDKDSLRWHQAIKVIDLEEQLENLEFENAICFIGFSSDEGVERNKGNVGAADGPNAIRREMCNFPKTREDITIYDAGNIFCIDEDLKGAQKALSTAVSKILALGMFPIVLGGGHEVAFGTYNGILDVVSRNKEKPKIGIINFDAHFDMRPYEEKTSSGTMFLEIADQCKERNLDFSYLVLGIQNYGNTRSLFKTAQNTGTEYILARDINDYKELEVKNIINKFIEKNDHIYVTICTDVFSSAYAPGVSAPQPFGIHPKSGRELIRHIAATGKTVSFDIAEVAPRYDSGNITSKLAAILIYELIDNLGRFKIKLS